MKVIRSPITSIGIAASPHPLMIYHSRGRYTLILMPFLIYLFAIQWYTPNSKF